MSFDRKPWDFEFPFLFLLGHLIYLHEGEICGFHCSIKKFTARCCYIFLDFVQYIVKGFLAFGVKIKCSFTWEPLEQYWIVSAIFFIDFSLYCFSDFIWTLNYGEDFFQKKQQCHFLKLVAEKLILKAKTFLVNLYDNTVKSLQFFLLLSLHRGILS